MANGYSYTKEYKRDYHSAWYQVNKVRSRQYRDKHLRERPVVAAWAIYRAAAKRRGIQFELPRELLNDLVTDCCFYCHKPPDTINGIDRVVNTLGYVEGNVVSCCGWCNTAKSDFTAAEFTANAKRVAAVSEGHV